MPAAFHHGTETIRVNGGSVPVYTVDGAIVGIVGTAPIGAVNELIVGQTKKDFAQFGGDELTGMGYTLPDALEIISRYAAGRVYIVNVLDPAKHKSNVSQEAIVIDPTTLIAQTQHVGLINLTVSDATGQVRSDEYDANLLTGEIRFKAIREKVKVTYDYADPTLVTEDDVRGGVEAATGKRKGLELLRTGFNLAGADAKIVLCPVFDAKPEVATAVETLASQLNAIAYLQAPAGTTLAQAIAGRGPDGTINFKTSSDRTHLFYPHVKGTQGVEALATHAAGLRLLTDVQDGYWFSTSNRQLKGVTGVEVSLTARVDDPQSETNRLNEVGITTVFNSYGTGFRLWGNRLACYPTTTHISNFEVVQRTADLIDESLRRVELQYVDRPIDDALIDSLIGTVETYMGTLKSIVGFSVSLDTSYDLVDAFSKGQVPIQYEFTPKIPAERITNTSVVTRKYLVNLVGNGGQ